MSGHIPHSGDAIICPTRRFISKISLIRVYADAGDVIETHEHKGDFNRLPYLLFGAASFRALDASF
jgi:hypothetical protein